MIFDRDVLEQKAVEALSPYGTEEAFFTEHAPKLVNWLVQQESNETLRGAWRMFGPYWQVMKPLLLKYGGNSSEQLIAWGVEHDYLAHFKLESNILNWVAAMLYLNKDGEYEPGPQKLHSISLVDGQSVVYRPDLGIVD